MPDQVTRVMCQFCRGGGVVWTPRMAVQWGSMEAFSLAAPSRCPECRGDGWFELVGGPTGGDSNCGDSNCGDSHDGDPD